MGSECSSEATKSAKVGENKRVWRLFLGIREGVVVILREGCD